MSFTHDKAGPTEVFSVSTSYAYRFRLDSKGKSRLSIGLSAGLTDWHGDWFNVNLEQAGDPVYQTSFSSWAPNFGAGIYYYNQNFYAGIGCPKLLEYDLHKATNNDAAFGRSYRHYYTTAGYAFPVNASGSLVMKTSILLKTTGLFSHYQRDAVIETIGAPTALDLDAALFFYDTFWLGAGYRTALQRGISSDDSISFLAAVHLRDGLRFGFAYDLTLSKLRKISSGSIELLAGYEFDLKIKRVHSPRYF
jgi:type IX secretion system PorP/SprF family membrane protein